jgi:hypothetical protein
MLSGIVCFVENSAGKSTDLGVGYEFETGSVRVHEGWRMSMRSLHPCFPSIVQAQLLSFNFTWQHKFEGHSCKFSRLTAKEVAVDAESQSPEAPEIHVDAASYTAPKGNIDDDSTAQSGASTVFLKELTDFEASRQNLSDVCVSTPSASLGSLAVTAPMQETHAEGVSTWDSDHKTSGRDVSSGGFSGGKASRSANELPQTSCNEFDTAGAGAPTSEGSAKSHESQARLDGEAPGHGSLPAPTPGFPLKPAEALQQVAALPSWQKQAGNFASPTSMVGCILGRRASVTSAEARALPVRSFNMPMNAQRSGRPEAVCSSGMLTQLNTLARPVQSTCALVNTPHCIFLATLALPVACIHVGLHPCS